MFDLILAVTTGVLGTAVLWLTWRVNRLEMWIDHLYDTKMDEL